MSYKCTSCKSVLLSVPRNGTCPNCGSQEFIPTQVVAKPPAKVPVRYLLTQIVLPILILVGLIGGSIGFIAYIEYWDYHTSVVVLQQTTCTPTEVPCRLVVFDENRGYQRYVDLVDFSSPKIYNIGEKFTVQNQHLGRVISTN